MNSFNFIYQELLGWIPYNTSIFDDMIYARIKRVFVLKKAGYSRSSSVDNPRFHQLLLLHNLRVLNISIIRKNVLQDIQFICKRLKVFRVQCTLTDNNYVLLWTLHDNTLRQSKSFPIVNPTSKVYQNRFKVLICLSLN